MNKTEVTKALNAAVHRGFLVPEWYHDEHPDAAGLRIVYLVAGITLPVAVFTFAKAFRHSSFLSEMLIDPDGYESDK